MGGAAGLNVAARRAQLPAYDIEQYCERITRRYKDDELLSTCVQAERDAPSELLKWPIYSGTLRHCETLIGPYQSYELFLGCVRAEGNDW